jgi:endonuclease YncB( thermonuclease family)
LAVHREDVGDWTGMLPDGMNLNQELVKQGWWLWYRIKVPGNTKLERLEKDAREARKGLWADPQPVPPWGVAETK